MWERSYQAKLIRELRRMFPGCIILKNDSLYLQGIPDLLILYRDRWAMLEVKRSESAVSQPNQSYYIDHLDKMSFAAFIYPENENEVLDDLQYTFSAGRSPRVSKRKQVSLDKL
jgi:hypothetical protein